MSDLISKSKVIELLYRVFDEYRIATDKTSTLGGFGSEVFKRVREMPTVYDIDKVVMEYGVAFKELDCSKHDNEIYNKALDDFVNFAKSLPVVEEEDGTIKPMRLEEMAEKLKAGETE